MSTCLRRWYRAWLPSDAMAWQCHTSDSAVQAIRPYGAMLTKMIWRSSRQNAKDLLALLDVEVHPGLIVLRESGLSRQEQWDRIEPVLQHLLTLDDANFMLNKVIEIEAPGRFLIREAPF